MLNLQDILTEAIKNSNSKLKLLLTSCGFDNKKFVKIFLDNIGKDPKNIKACFIPTAAIDQESKDILPACLKELEDDLQIPKENITTYNLDKRCDLTQFDTIYIAGGTPSYLIKQIHKANMHKEFLRAIKKGVFIIGVSAGSMIFSPIVKNHIPILDNKLDVHTVKRSTPNGDLPPAKEQINLGNMSAILILGTKRQIIS